MGLTFAVAALFANDNQRDAAAVIALAASFLLIVVFALSRLFARSKTGVSSPHEGDVYAPTQVSYPHVTQFVFCFNERSFEFTVLAVSNKENMQPTGSNRVPPFRELLVNDKVVGFSFNGTQDFADLLISRNGFLLLRGDGWELVIRIEQGKLTIYPYGEMIPCQAFQSLPLTSNASIDLCLNGLIPRYTFELHDFLEKVWKEGPIVIHRRYDPEFFPPSI